MGRTAGVPGESTSPSLLPRALNFVFSELALVFVRKAQSFDLCFTEVTNEAPGLKEECTQMEILLRF